MPIAKSVCMSVEPDEVKTSEELKEDEELLQQALGNLMSFIEEETTHYAFIPDPRNEEDYDTYEYGTEPIPFDDTWAHAEDDTPQLTSFVQDPDYYEFVENSIEPGSDEGDNCQ